MSKMDANTWVAQGKKAGKTRKVLKHELERAMKRAHPADRQLIAKREMPWPKLERPGPAYVGLAKKVVDAIEPRSESDPAALLMTFLAEFGNALGDKVYGRAESDFHPGRINVLLVGRTARARKGLAQNNTLKVMEEADDHWHQAHQLHALSTPEGLGRWLTHRRKQCTGKPFCSVPMRAMVTIIEFSALLRISSRQGNPLSEGIRSLWDGGILQVPTKKAPVFINGAHVSIIGHITAEELTKRITDTDMASGFANRFLFSCVERSKKIPNSKPLDLEAIGEEVGEALRKARKLGYLRRSKIAEKLWAKIYNELPDRRGAVGQLAARAEAQMLRLSVIYAAMDGRRFIKEEDVKAAHAVWEYCESSAMYIFGDTTGDAVADRILFHTRALGDHEWMGTQEIRNEVFSKHISGPELERVLGKLLSLGLVRSRDFKTGGRTRTEYQAVVDGA